MKKPRLLIAKVALLVAAVALGLSGCDMILGLVGMLEPALEVSPTSVTMDVGETVTVEVSAINAEGDAEDYILIVENEAIAEVSDQTRTQFKVTGLAQGSTEILVESDSGVSVTITVAVFTPPEPTLELGVSLLTIVDGNTVEVDVTALDEFGNDETFTATSGSTSIATVTADTVARTVSITGEAPGNVVISVNSASGLTDTVAVNIVAADQASLSLSTNSLTIDDGVSANVDVTAIDRFGNSESFTASSNNSGVASVLADTTAKTVTITGQAPGSATITVTSASSVQKTISVTVNSIAQAYLDVGSPSAQVIEGDTATVYVEARDATGAAETFSAISGDTAIATVAENIASNNIVITGVAQGSTTVTVTSASGLTGTVSVTVEAAASGYTISGSIDFSQTTVGPGTIYLQLYDYMPVFATDLPLADRNLPYNGTDATVAFTGTDAFVRPAGDYFLGAFVDANDNAVLDDGEAQGGYVVSSPGGAGSFFTLNGDITNASITLVDYVAPSEDAGYSGTNSIEVGGSFLFRNAPSNPVSSQPLVIVTNLVDVTGPTDVELTFWIQEYDEFFGNGYYFYNVEPGRDYRVDVAYMNPASGWTVVVSGSFYLENLLTTDLGWDLPMDFIPQDSLWVQIGSVTLMETDPSIYVGVDAQDIYGARESYSVSSSDSTIVDVYFLSDV